MLRVVREDETEEEAPGSVLNLCQGLLTSASSISNGLRADEYASQKRKLFADRLKIWVDTEEQLEMLQLWAEQATSALQQCKTSCPVLPTLQKADALTDAVQKIQQAASELQHKRGKQAVKQGPGKQSGCFKCFASAKGAVATADKVPGQRKFESARESLQSAVDVIRAVDAPEEDNYVFANWLPSLNPETDPFYKRPVAFDTVTTYLLAQKLPMRILIHGASGNGKTSLLRQLQHALTHQEHPLHERLAARFPGGLKWVDCGYALRISSPNSALELKQKALALAQDLLPQEDERLAQMDLANLAAVIKERLTSGPFLVIFDNVWDGTIFRRDCLNVLPDDKPGVVPQGTILVTSQFNLSSICQWHSPETITVPLSAESNMNACLSLLASVWSRDPSREELPEQLQVVGRRLVKECGSSPLAIKLLAPLLEGSSRERKWKAVLAELTNSEDHATFKRDSTGGEGSEAELPRVLHAFAMRAKALSPAMRHLLSVFGLFPPAQQIPVAAAVNIFAQIYERSVEEGCVLLRALARACYIEIRAPLGVLLAGTVTYHGLLKQFLVAMPDYAAVQLPGTANSSTMLCLALVVLYALPAYQQQALQVFSKLKQEVDSVRWEQAPKNRRNPLLEPFWLQLLSLTSDSELGAAARVPVISAARQLARLGAVTEALCFLFVDPRSLLAAAGVFSELAWQVQDRTFLHYAADQLEAVRAVSRLVIRLRELTAHEGSMVHAEELAVLSWALADLAELISDTARSKLRSEPVIPLLRSQYQGAAIYAYQRLQESLGL